MSVEDWNEIWYYKVTVLPSEGGFLMAGQLMSGDVEYEGYIYHVSAWEPPKGKTYVTTKMIKKAGSTADNNKA